MATQTTYFEFNKPSGTDLVNPLVDTNPNWDIADAGLHELDERSIANATEVVSLGVHAISRLNTYTKFIKWIATANYTDGETFTVDGNVVAASTPSGNTLVTGAYVTGAVVVACLNADDSAMTIFVSGDAHASDSDRLGGELPTYYAKQSDMTTAQTDIGNIKALNGTTSIASIGDGTLTGAVSAVNTALTDGADSFKFGVSNGEYGYIKKVGGADTWFPFSIGTLSLTSTNTASGTSVSISIPAGAKLITIKAENLSGILGGVYLVDSKQLIFGSNIGTLGTTSTSISDSNNYGTVSGTINGSTLALSLSAPSTSGLTFKQYNIFS